MMVHVVFHLGECLPQLGLFLGRELSAKMARSPWRGTVPRPPIVFWLTG